MASERAEELVDKADKLLLYSLKFPTMYHRQEEIKEAHQKTCSWIFCSPEIEKGSGCNTRPWGNFSQWLRHGNGVYWINGKAGSGKSTLMRYISQCSETRQLLKIWAGSGTVHLAGFYFWNSGAVDQRSQVGLLRSLLFAILKDRRDLIREIFQDEWNDISHSQNTEIVWCFGRLRKALLAVMSLATIQTKFFFFVDGLDEYDGDHEVIASLFKDISKSPYVKICLSSRPWQVFEETFSGCLALRLQDLTSDDIRQYVKDNFEANSKFQQLSKLDPMNTSLFSDEIVAKANGVFLWVYLVVKSLLDGLRNRDSIFDLQRRLKMLPSDLNALYNHMLDRVTPIYMADASRIFQIYDFMSEQNCRPSILELELAVSSRYSSAVAKITSLVDHVMGEEINHRCEQMSVHLKTRCEGLLEVHDIMDQKWESTDDIERDLVLDSKLTRYLSGCGSDRARERVKYDWKVTYLHRTVKDFLKGDSARAKLFQQTAAITEFDPYTSVLMSYVIGMKRSVCSSYFDATLSHEDRVWRIMRDTLLAAQWAQSRNDPAMVPLLHEVSTMGYHSLRREIIPIRSSILDPEISPDWQSKFLTMVIHFGLDSYLEEAFKTHQRLPQRSDGFSFLSHALGLAPTVIPMSEQPVFPAVVKTLLRYGADPNERFNNSCTLWQYVLHLPYRTMPTSSPPPNNSLRRCADVFEAMIQHNADIDIICDINNCPFKARQPLQWKVSEHQIRTACAQSHTVVSIIRDSLSTKLPDAASALYRMIQERRQVKLALINMPDSQTQKRQHNLDVDEHRLSEHNINIRQEMEDLCNPPSVAATGLEPSNALEKQRVKRTKLETRTKVLEYSG
jgi:hypothetical protein